VIPELLLIALATLVSEDLTCIATGVLIAQGKLSFAEGTAACLGGIFGGDMLLFLAGRLVGRRALRWPPFARVLPPTQVERGASWLERRGLVVIFLSRFTPGLRLATYFAAGLLPTSLATFTIYFLLAAAVWTPILVGAASVFGGELLRGIFAQGSKTMAAFAAVFALLAVLIRLVRPLTTFAGRRRLLGFLARIVRWEFWPPWAAYAPLVPYLLYLALRHRSLTLFTAANPGIASGGFVGESKSRILSHLSVCEGAVAEFALIPEALDPAGRVQAAQRFLNENGVDYPVVLKSDVGERGSGVAVLRTTAELEAYLQFAPADTIIQRHIPGAEFGVFYYRFPHERRGRIFSITEKLFPQVKGDGRSTLRELILRDARAVCMATAYEKVAKRPLDEIPADGEAVQLVELGSHCRGAVFLDAAWLKTTALEDAIDRVSQAHLGFYFGRFDIRTPSVEAFREGRSFRVIELNGVSAEATHIYDPAVSLWEAYRVMFQQWKIAFAIGAANRERGVQPMGISALLRLVAGLESRQRSRGMRVQAIAENRAGL